MMAKSKVVRDRVPCPVKPCRKSEIDNGIDVRGLKTHLVNKHGYEWADASRVWEQVTGRKSKGRPAKRKETELVAPVVSHGPDERLAWFQAGVEYGRKLGRGE